MYKVTAEEVEAERFNSYETRITRASHSFHALKMAYKRGSILESTFLYLKRKYYNGFT